MPEDIKTLDGGEAPAAHRASAGGTETHGAHATTGRPTAPAGDTMNLDGGAAPGDYAAPMPVSSSRAKPVAKKDPGDPPLGGVARRR